MFVTKLANVSGRSAILVWISEMDTQTIKIAVTFVQASFAPNEKGS